LKKYQQEQENERTIMKTKQHVNLFQDYIKETKDDSTPTHEIDPEILDHYLSAFFCFASKHCLDSYNMESLVIEYS
jgi:hypothetical protein